MPVPGSATPNRPRPTPQPFLSFHHRVAVSMALVLAVCAAALGAVAVRTSARRSFDDTRRQGLAIARLLALVMAEGPAKDGASSGDDAPAGVAASAGPASGPRLETLLERIAADGDPVHIEIVDEGGAVLAEGGVRGRRPVFDLRGAADAIRGPSGPEDTVPGLDGGRLYVFTFPARPATRREDPSAATDPPRRAADRGSILAPRAAVAASRPGDGGARGREVRVAFSAARIADDRKAHTARVGIAGALVVLAGTFAASWTARRFVAGPALAMAAAADRLAQGDLTARAGAAGRGELAVLSSVLDRLAGGLETTFGRLDESTRRLEETIEGVHANAAVVVTGAREGRESLGRISAVAQSMSSSVRRVAGHVGGLSAACEQTSSSIVGMAAKIEEVAGLADGLTMSINDTSATTEEVVASIKEIDRNVELLNRFVVETSQAMAEMESVLQRVERTAADSKAISEVVAQNAGHGMRAVELTMEGMEGIRGSVQEASGAIETVGRRSQEIGMIVNVIQDVTEQTNLLALNAAIIAAQAGEHGRGFAVVAEEIRQLAERTASSAKEIYDLIGSFQSETGRAVAAMHEGSRRVLEGSERSREAGRALKAILESAERSSALVSEIASATRVVVTESQDVSASVDRVHEMTAQIRKSTAGQTQGSEQIMSAVENMREMSLHVKQATIDQGRGSRQIAQAVGQVSALVAAIHAAAGEQAGAADDILKALGGTAERAAAGLAAAARAQAAMGDLRSRVQVLRAQIDRHRTRV